MSTALNARLLVAAQSGDVEAVRCLLQRGANPNVFTDGDTPASLAARAGHHDCFRAIRASEQTRAAFLYPQILDPCGAAPVMLFNTCERDRCVMAAKLYHELAFLLLEFHLHRSAPQNASAIPCNDATQLALLFFAPHGTFCSTKWHQPLSVAVKITPTAMRACVGATLEDTTCAIGLAKSTLIATESHDASVRSAALDVLRETVQSYRCALLVAAVPLEPTTAYLAVPDGSCVRRMLTNAWGLFMPLHLHAPRMPGHTAHPVRVHNGVLGVHVGIYATERAAGRGADGRVERDTIAICPNCTWIIRDDHVEVMR